MLGCLRRICGGADSTNRTPLPKGIIAVLYAFLLFNAMTMTMVFSYLPQLVKSFGTSEVDTGLYAGLIATSLFIGRVVFSFAWGFLADHKGKKFAAIASATGLTLSTLAFGFSYNFTWAFLTRLLQGCFMGLIVACKSILSDRCDDTNIALGMSLIISAFSAGLVLGPSCAGFLVFPGVQYPDLFTKDNIFSKYGILLPNFIIFIGFIITTILGVKLLPKDQRNDKDDERSYLLNPFECKEGKYGEENDVVGFKRKNSEAFLTFSIKRCIDKNTNNASLNYFQIIEPKFGISSTPNANATFKEKWRASKAKEVLTNKWCVVSCILFGTFSLVVIGFDELVSLYMATSKVYRGMGFTTSNIGVAMLISAMLLIVLQVALLPTLTTKYGSRKIMIGCLLTMAFCFPLIPCIGAIKNEYWMWFALCFVLMVCQVGIAGASLAINILVNNSVGPSLLGSANGLAMSLASVGRMIAPTLIGSTYSWSMTNIKGVKGNENALGFPLNHFFAFFILSICAIINCIIVYMLPPSLDKKIVLENEDTEHSGNHHSNVTNVTVSYFTPAEEPSNY